MDEHDWLAERFEENRTHLRAVAYRMLGSVTEADDAVQESWLRLSRSARRMERRLAAVLEIVERYGCGRGVDQGSSGSSLPF